MPSDLPTPFVELDGPLCQAFLRLTVGEEPGPPARCPAGPRRAISACPEPLEEAGGASVALWSLPSQWGWAPALPPPSLPCRAQRSASLPEGRREGGPPAASRYKTELCRTYEESGGCKYGAKCQFAHGAGELRGLSRHPKYKTELCRTFHTAGFCPYGSRCHFIHNAEEQRPRPGARSPAFSRSPLPCRRAGGPPFPAPLGQDGTGGAPADAFASPRQRRLRRSPSAGSLSDQEDSGGSSGSESPGLGPGGRRLPIFSRLSVSD